jgi:phage-related protein
MPRNESIVCEGVCFTIEWGIVSNDQCQAKEYYEALDTVDRAKALALFKRMADFGKIFDKTKFIQETQKLYAFKPRPHRFFCFFFKGKRIFIVSAYQKQTEKAPQREIRRAASLRIECLKEIAREEMHGNEKD